MNPNVVIFTHKTKVVKKLEGGDTKYFDVDDEDLGNDTCNNTHQCTLLIQHISELLVLN